MRLSLFFDQPTAEKIQRVEWGKGPFLKILAARMRYWQQQTDPGKVSDWRFCCVTYIACYCFML
jgi:hypothetical protein